MLRTTARTASTLRPVAAGASLMLRSADRTSTLRPVAPVSSGWVRRLSVLNAGSELTVANAIAKDHCTILYFSAGWCGPCKTISPIFTDLAKQYPDSKFIKIDVDDLPEVAAEHNVKAMPTFQIYKAGHCLDTIVGADKQKLKEQVERHATTLGANE